MKSADSPSWTAAKAVGDAGEAALAKWFRRRGFEVTKCIEPAKSFDLLVQSRIEVKHDLQAARTGNVAVEVSHGGEPSGIVATTSDLWIVVTDAELLFIPTARLRDFVIGETFPEVPAGDQHAARVKLVPLSRLCALPFVRTIPRSAHREDD